MADEPRTVALLGGRDVVLGDGRDAREVAADAAGEVFVHVANCPIAYLKAHLSWRQHTALTLMAEAFGKGGGRRIGAQPGRGEGPDADPAKRREYADLEAAAGLRVGPHIRTLCQGDWPLAPWLTLRHIEDALDRVADRLRLAR